MSGLHRAATVGIAEVCRGLGAPVPGCGGVVDLRLDSFILCSLLLVVVASLVLLGHFQILSCRHMHW